MHDRNGSSVATLRWAKGEGGALVGPLPQECLRHPSIQFLWLAVRRFLHGLEEDTVRCSV